MQKGSLGHITNILFFSPLGKSRGLNVGLDYLS